MANLRGTAGEPGGWASLGGSADRDAATRQLEAIDNLVGQKNWSRLIEECQSLLSRNGDVLVPLSERHLVPVRWLVHQRLAQLPEEALKLYRGRVDPQTKKKIEQGIAQREPIGIRRAVEDAFCCTAGDRALEWLGDLAFEQGRFAEARFWWQQLVPPVDAQRGVSSFLAYPDGHLDPAVICAKELLALIFSGDGDIASALAAYKTKYGSAKGSLGGQTGNLADFLEGISKQFRFKGDDVPLTSWPTFAGEESRRGAQGLLPHDPNFLARLAAAPACEFDLHLRTFVADAADEDHPAPSGSEPWTAFPFHPVISGRLVLLADPGGVTAYDPVRRQAFAYRDRRFDRFSIVPDAVYSLSLAGHRVVARLGDKASGKVVCLNWSPSHDPNFTLRWEANPPPSEDKTPWAFDGSPVADENRVFVSMSQSSATRTKSALVCYSLDSGAMLWRKDVCEGSAAEGARGPAGRNQLTLSEGRLYYCSHTGVVAGLEQTSGRFLWVCRYPSQLAGNSGMKLPRTSCPVVAVGGRVFVAPDDYDRLLCLDAFTGHRLWDRDRIEPVQLLGAGEGRVIAVTREGIRWFSVGNGRDIKSYPEGGTGALPSSGRGLLASGLVLWPSRQGLYVFNQVDGEIPENLNTYNLLAGHSLGNLAITNEVLVIAGSRRLTIHVLKEKQVLRSQ